MTDSTGNDTALLATGHALQVWWIPFDDPRSQAGPRLEAQLGARTVAREAVRAACARILGVPQTSLTGIGTGQRPQLPGIRHVSISRTVGRAVIALCTDPNPAIRLGVDVEWTGRDVDPDPIVRQFFDPNEAGTLRALPPAAARSRFFALWTWKEALLKSGSAGLGAPLPIYGTPSVPPHTASSFWPEPDYVVTLVTQRWTGSLTWHFTVHDKHAA